MYRILLADNDASVLKGTERLLTVAGFEVVPTQSGSRAAALLSEPTEHFDVVVSDLDMPGVSGLNLVELMRANPRTAKTPFFLVTSHDEPGVVEGCTTHRAELWPKGKPDLAEEVARLLAKN